MAASLNKVFMMGNLTRDPELRQAGGQQICGFGIALNRTYQTARGETREDVCYVDVEAWGRTADIVSQYARKGSPLFVEGRLRYDQWDDRETGKKRSRLTVTAENVQLLGGPRDNNGMPPQGGYAEDMPGGQRPYYQQPPQGGQPYYGQAPAPQQPYGRGPANGGYYQQPPQGAAPAYSQPAPPPAYSQPPQGEPPAAQQPPQQGAAPAMPAFQPPAEDDADTPF
ncbi:MAG: single-stranded DNA-binding protein [Victivallales bacterium]|nr:single-stranded DNA-binding protein [Victivallales bacterium]